MPCLHYNDERRERISTERSENVRSCRTLSSLWRAFWISVCEGTSSAVDSDRGPLERPRFSGLRESSRISSLERPHFFPLARGVDRVPAHPGVHPRLRRPSSRPSSRYLRRHRRSWARVDELRRQEPTARPKMPEDLDVTNPIRAVLDTLQTDAARFGFIRASPTSTLRPAG